MACLDTTVLVDIVRCKSGRKERAFKKLHELSDRGESLVTTRFNVAELYVGVERSDDSQREQRAVDAMLRDIGILDFDDTAARLFGQITAHLQQLGTPAGDMDVLIAATAMTSGHCLVTRNPAHFTNISQLIVESY